MTLLSSNATVGILAGRSVSFLVVSFASTALTALTVLLVLRPTLFAVAPRIWTDKWFWMAGVLKCANDLAFFYAVITSEEIDATVVVYLYPITNILLGAWLLGPRYKRLGVKDWVLVALSFVAIVLMTPFSAVSSLSPIVFGVAFFSVATSAYTVFLQVLADKHGFKQKDEIAAIGLIFVLSTGLHAVLVAALWVMRPDLLAFERHFFGDPFLAVAALLWIGIVVNIGWEGLWVRAARLYDAISLKSVFYLSPALGACYMVLLGIDDLDAVVLFALTGVIVSNVLIHQNQIDDLAFVAFLLGLFGSTVFVALSGPVHLLQSFAVSTDRFDLQITFVSIFGGFLLFRAFELHQSCSQAFARVVTSVIRRGIRSGRPVTGLEPAFDRLAREPDIALWEIDDLDEKATDLERHNRRAEKKLRAFLMEEGMRAAYFTYFKQRTTGVTYTETFLMVLICLFTVPAILAQAITTQTGGFIAVFGSALFFFLPVLVIELAYFRLGRAHVGVLYRRALFLESSGDLNPEKPEADQSFLPQARYQKTQGFKAVMLLTLTVICCAASMMVLRP